MSAVASTQPAPRIHASTEQHVCGQCEQGVTPTDVAMSYPKTLSKSVRVYCEHCNVTTVADYELNGSCWSLVGRIEKLKGRHLEAPKRKSA